MKAARIYDRCFGSATQRKVGVSTQISLTLSAATLEVRLTDTCWTIH